METTLKHTAIQPGCPWAVSSKEAIAAVDIHGLTPVHSSFPSVNSQSSDIAWAGIIINLVLVIAVSILASGILNLLLLIP